MPVSPVSKTFYADWRVKHAPSVFLGETDVPVSERLLQNIWHHQRLLRDQLRTLDGQPVRVLHPGFWNHEAGPDFRGAMVQIGDEPARSGDVEIDLRTGGWHAHGHDRNPRFENVILHVVWEPGDVSKIPGPTLALERFLDSPVIELMGWHGSESAKAWPAALAGRCCAPLSELSEEKRTELLQQAACVRFQTKANQFQTRARQAGWEQALWEGIFRGLGYKQNVWPMLRLGEVLAHEEPGTPGAKASPAQTPDSALAWQARLLGVGGLLPAPGEGVETDAYLRSVWDIWWRERQAFSDCILPKSLWRFNGMRPANLPQRRLALASHWLASKNFVSKLEKWFTDQNTASTPWNTLLELLQVEDDPFWSWHWTYRSVRLPSPQPLLGGSRVSDLAINVILPWFWIRAVSGKNDELKLRAEEIYFKWPAADDNSVLRLARQRLLGGSARRRLPTAALQQGLLQVVKDFCEHSNAICEDCRFPELVRSWNLQPDGTVS